MKLSGKRALVTGAGRGIGAAVARALAAEGAQVVLAARTEAEVESLAHDLHGESFVCDVGDPDSIAALAAAVGAVDILVNNAGTSSSSPLKGVKLADWNRLLSVNATGTFLCSQAFLPAMLAAGWGRIINIASVAGLQGAKYITAYCASKHAMVGFTRALANEVARAGVTVNAICPGYVNTPMTQASLDRIQAQTGRTREQALEALTATSPQGRLVEPEEVAYLALCLCDPLARSINGQALVLE